MNKVAKSLICVAFIFAFCFLSVGYAAVQDTLNVNGTVSVEAQNEPFAVYGPVYDSDGDLAEYALNFYNRPIAQAGDEIPLGEGKQVVTAVYTADAWSFNEPEEQPWRSCLESEGRIESVAVIDDNIQPTKTRSWFADFTDCKTFDLAKLDTSKVTEMGYMFKNCTAIQHLDLSSFDTSGLKDYDMEGACLLEMFRKCSNLETLDISSFNTGNVISIEHMFSYCGKLTTIYCENSFGVNNPYFWRIDSAFVECTSLKGGNGTIFDSSKDTAEYARIDLPGQAGYFTHKQHIFVDGVCSICGHTESSSGEEGGRPIYADPLPDGQETLKSYIDEEDANNLLSITAESSSVVLDLCYDEFGEGYYSTFSDELTKIFNAGENLNAFYFELQDVGGEPINLDEVVNADLPTVFDIYRITMTSDEPVDGGLDIIFNSFTNYSTILGEDQSLAVIISVLTKHTTGEISFEHYYVPVDAVESEGEAFGSSVSFYLPGDLCKSVQEKVCMFSIVSPS